MQLHINNINFIKSQPIAGTAFNSIEERLNAYYRTLDDNILILLNLI